MTSLIVAYLIGALIGYIVLRLATGKESWDDNAGIAIISLLIWWLIVPLIAYAWVHEKVYEDPSDGSAAP